MWMVLLFALAVSLDGFGVGYAYGMRNIIIPFRSLLVISLTSTVAIAFSMLSGKMLANLIPLDFVEVIGALILALMGLYMLLQAWVQRKNSIEALPGAEDMLIHFRIPSLGILVQVLREPSQVDLDHSGVISVRESFILGFALAMDALGAGFAVAVAGFPPIWTAFMVGMCKMVLIPLAVIVGRYNTGNWLGRKTAYVPGLILLLLSITKFK